MKNRLLIAALFAFVLPTNSNAQAVLCPTPCLPTYGPPCTSPGVNDLIDNFWTVGGLTDISNLSSGCCFMPDNYIFYPGMPLITEPGATIETNIQCATPWQQGFSIWVDWNNDCDFDDPGEKIYSSPTSGFGVFTGTFTVPAGIECGSYRLRARCEYFQSGATIFPCDYNYYGECEDYPVIIENCEPTICEGDTVELDFTASDPGPGATYSWSPATNISDPTGGPIVEVWPDDTTTYTVTITDVTGTFTIDFPVNVVPIPTPDAGMDDSICFSDPLGYELQGTLSNNGAFYWDLVSGGIPTWAPSATDLTPNVTVDASGFHDFVIYEEDTNAVCPDGSDTVTILFSEEVHITDFTDPVCNGNLDGTITITSMGSVGADQYSVDGGLTWQAGNVFTGLGAGTYDVMSMDPLGCTHTSSVTLTDPPLLLITTSADTTICQNGTASPYITGATGPGTTFTYYWSHSAGTSSSEDYTPAPVGTDSIITVYAISDLGCVSDTQDIAITHYDPITLTISPNDTVCPGDASSHTVTAVGGYMGYTYSWTENGGMIGDITSTINKNPNMVTTYCVTVADGCETDPVNICVLTDMREVPNPEFISDISASCQPAVATFTDMTTISETANWTISGVDITGDVVTFNFDGVGFHDVSLEVISEYGCVNKVDVSGYFQVYPDPEPMFYITPNPTTTFDTDVQFMNATDGTNTYLWTMPDGVPGTSTVHSPKVTYPQGVEGIYPVTLHATNEYGCTAEITSNLTVVQEVFIYAPNVFVPDGDEYNEEWKVYIEGIDIYDFHLMVFNRWGEVVWESYNPAASWNGHYSDQGIKEGTYVWQIDCKEQITDKKHKFRGHVTILK